MRLIALFPVICTVVALILAFLCTFAGTNNDILERYDLLTLNTSRIAVDIFNTTASSDNSSGDDGGDNWITQTIHDIGDAIANVTDAVENDIENALNSAFDSFARTLGLSDFYSVHILNYCEGYYSPNGTSSRNVTSCSSGSKLSGASAFSPGSILQAELNAAGLSITLADLHWPDQIDEALGDIKTAFNAAVVIYSIAIALTGISFLLSALGLFLRGRPTSLGNIIVASLAFLVLLISSAIVTAGTTQAVSTINKYGAQIDVNASRGNRFLALTWSATILMLLVGVTWFVEFFLEKRRTKKIPKQLQ